MARNGIWSGIALLVFVTFASSNASASWLSFAAHLQANTGEFRITNLSDDGFELTGLTLQLGDNAVFNTSTLNLGALLDAGTTLTFTPLADAVVNGSASALFEFSGFETGDAFGFKTRFADLLNGGHAAGSDFNNAMVIATFSNGQILETGFAGGPTTPSSDRKAFVFTTTVEAVHNPEPGSLMLLALGAATIGAYQVRGRRRSSLAESGVQ